MSERKSRFSPPDESESMRKLGYFNFKSRVMIGGIGLLFMVVTEIWGFDWKHYGTNEEGSYFYETESMKRVSQNVFRVCVQSIYTEKGVAHWVKEGGEAFKDLDFSLLLSEYHCIERSIRHLIIRFYSKKGEVYYPARNEEWHFFVPDAMSEVLFQKICQ